MLDFPASPTNGQKYPASPIAGVPVYTWDGEKWKTPSTQTGDAVSTAYVDQQDALRVRHDAPQGLAATNQTTGRSNVYAAPFDALAYSGMQLNGSFEVSQSIGNTAAPGGYLMDGWLLAASNSTGVLACNQGAALSSPITAGVYFPYFLSLRATTAFAAPTASDYLYFTNTIEGYRAARLCWGMGAGAVPVTICFWVFSTVGGTLAVGVANGAHDRSYVVDVPVTNVWQYKTVTIPGDTAGTWERTTNAGLRLMFAAATGTNYQTTPGAWVAGNKFATSATSNLFNAVNASIYVAGVVVLPGIEAPSAARSPFIMRPYDQELITCKRYYQKWTNVVIDNGYNIAGPYSFTSVQLAPEMRATPTVAFSRTAYDNMQGAQIVANDNKSVAVSALTIVTGAGTTTCDLIADARL